MESKKENSRNSYKEERRTQKNDHFSNTDNNNNMGLCLPVLDNKNNDNDDNNAEINPIASRQLDFPWPFTPSIKWFLLANDKSQKSIFLN